MHLTFVDPALLCQTDGTWGRERGGDIQPSGYWCCRSSDMPVRSMLVPFGGTSNTQRKEMSSTHGRNCATTIYGQQNLSSNLQFDIDQMGPRATADGKAGGTCGTADGLLQERSPTKKLPKMYHAVDLVNHRFSATAAHESRPFGALLGKSIYERWRAGGVTNPRCYESQTERKRDRAASIVQFTTCGARAATGGQSPSALGPFQGAGE